MEKLLNILVIEDHEIVTWALELLVKENFDGAIFRSADNFDKGLALLGQERASLVILDILVPGGNTTTMITGLRKIQPSVPILIHTGLPENSNALKFLMAGANGFISKTDSLSLGVVAIKRILSGKRYISEAAQEIIQDAVLKKGIKNVAGNHLRLTAREKVVTRLLLRGSWTKDIANKLGLKDTTVSTHKANIFQKFAVNNQVELLIRVQNIMPELLLD